MSHKIKKNDPITQRFGGPPGSTSEDHLTWVKYLKDDFTTFQPIFI